MNDKENPLLCTQGNPNSLKETSTCSLSKHGSHLPRKMKWVREKFITTHFVETIACNIHRSMWCPTHYTRCMWNSRWDVSACAIAGHAKLIIFITITTVLLRYLSALTFKWESHGPHAIVLSSVRDPHTHSHSSGSVVQRVRHTYVNVRESLIRAKMINLACPRTSAPISTSVMHNA